MFHGQHDENLCRAELTTSQRTTYTKRRKQIWEALHPTVKTDVSDFSDDSNTQRVELLPGDSNRTSVSVLENSQNNSGTTGSTIHPKKAGRPKQFAASTAKATGMTKQAINRALARADALGDDALAKVTNTSLDSGVELDALAKMDAPERAAPQEFTLLLGRRYNRAKKAVGKPLGTILGQIEPISTADRLASEHGVSPATVKRAGQYADAIADTAGNHGAGFADSAWQLRRIPVVLANYPDSG